MILLLTQVIHESSLVIILGFGGKPLKRKLRSMAYTPLLRSLPACGRQDSVAQQCVIVNLFEKTEKTTHCLGMHYRQLRELWKVKSREDQTQRHQSPELSLKVCPEKSEFPQCNSSWNVVWLVISEGWCVILQFCWMLVFCF